jgi:hypothetical protein
VVSARLKSAKAIVVGLSAFAASAAIAAVVARAVVDEGQPRYNVQLQPGPSLSSQQRAEMLTPGKPWDGVGRGTVTQTDVDTFSEFPLMWTGTQVLGFNLQEVQRASYAAPASVGGGGENSVRFLYGVCTEPGMRERTCPGSQHILVEPACDVTPDQIHKGALPASRLGSRHCAIRRCCGSRTPHQL